jgi:hypothetical protein
MKIIQNLSSLVLHPVLLLLLVGVLLSASIYSYLKYQESDGQLKKVQVELDELRKSPQSSASEIRILVDRVGRIVALPQNETPTVATITDVEKLKEQPFFANAQNGDKILIYSQARKAYLYRPEENKIIEVAPINIKENQSQPAGEGTDDQTPTEPEESESIPSPTPSEQPTPTPTFGEEQ